MALVLKDRVRESSTSSGTGSITLAGAYTGYQTFASAVASGSTVYYTIHNTTSPNDGEWEVGVGTFTAPSTLSRDTVFSSSTGGSKVSFSSASVLEVFITQPSEQAVYINDATGKVEAFGNGTNVITFTEINTTNLTANTVTLTAGTITTNAANNTDITNKQYVDGLFSQSISYHAPVLVESPTALNAVYVQPNGAGNGVGATLTNNGANVALVIDGVTLSNTARVLVYTQANAVQNGIYTVTNPGNSTAQWVLTRATDADTYGVGDPNKLGGGDAVFVQSGDTGAGETYVCNTQGTITFGSTNITFAQISSAQVYSAGTGLSLNNTTFSISNTTVVSGLYGDSANVAVIEVNAQGQLTSASNSAINVSNITVGTLSNDRTTASASNGANTIVLRDANGSFNANVGTFTTVNATNGNFTNISANGVGLTDINASNITSGTISNARTTGNTANSANTLVLRDANGSFGANIVAGAFSGDGAALTGINASNISSGTIDNSRTTAASANGASTIVQRDSGGNFSANTITANVAGSGAGLTNINASNITSGTIGNAYTTANSSNGASTIVLRGASGEFAAGAITADSFSGNGTNITAINASAITTGTIANARTTASSANGASTIVARDADGSFAGNVITAITSNATTFNGTTGSFTNVSGNGVALTAINASNISSGTIANARTTAASANGANTIVLRDASGDFEVDGITANWFTGNGANLSAINASNVSSGTLSATRGGTGSANLTANNVLLGNGANSVQFVAPGTNGNVLTSNGTTWVSQAAGSSGTVIPAGTVMIFGQTTAPTGFTKLTNQDNAALRVVSGTASSGGSLDFTTAFASRSITGSVGSTGSTTLSTSQIPSHDHANGVSSDVDWGQVYYNISGSGKAGRFGMAPGGSGIQGATSSTGGGGSHNHSGGTFTGDALNMSVKYVDVIRATKD